MSGLLSRLYAGVAEQETRAAEAPRRCAVLRAIQEALSGVELSLLDFDPSLPENVAAYKRALHDVRCELTAGGRLLRAHRRASRILAAAHKGAAMSTLDDRLIALDMIDHGPTKSPAAPSRAETSSEARGRNPLRHSISSTSAKYGSNR